MGYLLKEALKTLCCGGVNNNNQCWSYAAFWKFGLQNPKLLIWEDCYYGQASCLDVQAGEDMVHLLVNKMMIDNHFNIVGEGLVGRVAFTGNHQWILSENYYRESHPTEVLKEICQQFSAGMQTVAVVPVLPHGVLQFGSYMPIGEDIGFVNDVVSLVLQLGQVPGVLLSDNYAANELPPKIEDPLYSTPGASSLDSNMINASSSSISESFNYMGTLGQTCLFDSQTSYSFAPSQASSFSKYEDVFVQSQSGDDLFDILGADFKNKLLSDSSKNKWENNNSNISLSSQDNSESGIFSLVGTDHLLDAMVSKVSCPAKQNLSLDDSISCKTTLTNISSSSKPNVSDEMKGISEYLAKAGASSSKESSRTYSQCSSIYDAWIEKGNNVKHDNNSVSTGYSKKPQETGNKPSRKRSKPGENPRPRPKDRQMIQDRVKELREIVPNGAKCSIDALLERTIKHMLFMQSVTKHADKLKQNPESKIISNDGGLLLKDNFEGGATWAYEIGSQSMVCPIIVEDLNQPRQMLVEMLCEERGMFLEIADIIRGLGLTILKGVMETRNDKIWARFAVEANRDVTRMEIFLSLVQLLEQSSKTGVPHHNNICNSDLMVQHFRQGACVPTTGQIC